MDIIAVTGTKGTTTVTHFIYEALKAANDQPIAFVSTMGIFDGKDEIDNGGFTTPPAPIVHNTVKRAEANGCAAFALELSSIGEKEGRAAGLPLKYGVFTNFAPDHIGSVEEHASLEEYYHYKRQIVARYENAILNKDVDCFDDMVKASQEGNGQRVISFSTNPNSGADVYAKDIQRTVDGMSFTVVTPAWTTHATVGMPGIYNVSNALAAFSVIYLMGLNPAVAANAIAATKIPGRSETYAKKGRTVIVDYAHNSISFNALLTEMRIRHPDGKIRILYGVGGNRGERRRGMAHESALLADLTYVTSDNPRDEDPNELCRTLAELIQADNGKCEIIVEREAAVRKALQDMAEGDVLILAGKGPETSITIGNVTYPNPGDAKLASDFINSL